MPKKPSKSTVKWFFIILAVAVIYLYAKMIAPFALALVTAGIFAVILAPAVRFVEARVKYRWLAVLIVVFLLVLLVLTPLFFVGVMIAEQASQIVQTSFSPGGFFTTFHLADSTIFQSMPEFVQEQLLTIDITNLGKRLAQWVVANLGDVASRSAAFIFNGFIFLLSLISFLIHQEKIRTLLLELSPLKDKLDVSILTRMVSTVRAVVLGALIIALVQSTLAAIGLTIFNVPGALLLGALVIVASQIPTVGVGLVMIPAIVYLVLTGQYANAVGLTIWATFVVGLVDNFLSPIILGARTKMPELLILISVLGGLQLFGPIGFIVGPTVLAAVMVLVDLYKHGILED